MHIRKKQKQLERFSHLTKSYKNALDNKEKEDGLKQSKSKSDVYAFTPQGFKYENKRYKYIKYTKHNMVSHLL